MALLKEIETNNGVNVNYWRIVQMNNIISEGRLQVVMLPYLSKQARDAKKAPFNYPATIEISGLDYAAEMTREEVYQYAKTLPEFADAVDA